MKRLIALLVLGVGALVSIPLSAVEADMPSHEELEFQCRQRLRFSRNQFLNNLQLDQLRRCVRNTRIQYERADELQRRLNRYDQQYYKRYEHGQEILRISRRSLKERIHQQEDIRKSYYKTVSLDQRHQDLLRHRVERRRIIREKENQLMREKQEKLERWRTAVKACRYIRAGFDREACITDFLRR